MPETSRGGKNGRGCALTGCGPIEARRLRAVSALVAAAALLGCAYSFRGSNLPGHIRTVAVPNFSNATLEPGIEQEATAAVIDRFIQDGRLKLAPEGQADSRLAGTVSKYENRVNNYGPDQSPRDYIVVVTVGVEMKDQVKNNELWSDASLTRTAVYVPGSPSGPATERDARQEAIRSIAGEIVTRTLEQW